MNKKGQVIPIAFLLLSVALIILFHIFYNVYYGTKYEKFVFGVKIVDTARNLLETFKSYLKLALNYASHQSLREHACVGGTIEVRDGRVIVAPWICNGPTPVPPELSKDCLAIYTNYYLNVYKEKFNTSLPLILLSSDFKNCSYDVKDIMSGEYDEGNFSVKCSFSSTSVLGKNVTLTIHEEISTQAFITRNRYWYLFRIFTEWARDDVFSPCICSKIGCACSASSEAEECSSDCLKEVEECAKKALEDLQRRFDEYVECKKERICCAQGRGPACLPPSPCLSWENMMCSADCEHNCDHPPKKVCPPKSATSVYHSSSLLSNYLTNPSTILRFQERYSNLQCKCLYWHEARLAAAYKFECKDYKYFVPSSKGPIPLTFSVSAYAFWRDPDVCQRLIPCKCPEDATSCEDCKAGNCCTGCFS